MSTQSSSAPDPTPPRPLPRNTEEAKIQYEKLLADAGEGCDRFCPLSAVVPAMKDKVINVIGILRDIGTPAQTKGNDMMQTIRVRDPSVENDVMVRIFRKSEPEFPNPMFGTGQQRILILRGMKVFFNRKENEWILIETYNYSYVMVTDLPGDPLPNWEKGPDAVTATFTMSVLGASRALDVWYKFYTGRVFENVPGAAPDTITEQSGVRIGSRRETKIQDMDVNDDGSRRFYDVFGKIVKVHDPQSNRLSLFITDYTKNPKLYPYTYDENGEDGTIWNGPLGRHTLQITVWDQNAQRARELNLMEGMYIFCRNVATKMNSNSYLEGSLHPDKQWSNKALIHLIEKADARIEGIKARMQVYALEYEQHREEYVIKSTQEERDARKAKRKETIQELKPVLEEDDHHEDDEEEPVITKNRSEVHVSQNIRIEQDAEKAPETLISKILREPEGGKSFRNFNYHIFCKVIDFLPEDILDFAQPIVPGEVDYDTEDLDLDLDEYPDGVKWTWRFKLLVEGLDGASMQLVVSGDEAEYLLKVKPCNLRDKNNSETLHVLKEQLTKLWGNLDETKRAALEKLQTPEPKGKPKPANPPPHPHQSNAPGGPGNGNGGNKRKRKRPRGGKKKQRTGNAEPAKKDEEAGSEDEDEEQEQKVAGRYFDACIFEYGVKEAGAVQRYWKIVKTSIM